MGPIDLTIHRKVRAYHSTKGLAATVAVWSPEVGNLWSDFRVVDRTNKLCTYTCFSFDSTQKHCTRDIQGTRLITVPNVWERAGCFRSGVHILGLVSARCCPLAASSPLAKDPPEAGPCLLGLGVVCVHQQTKTSPETGPQ